MIDLLVVVFCLYLGYQIGVSVTAFRLRHLILKEAKARGYDVEVVTEEVSKKIYELEVEKINDTLYLYNRKEKEFVCQGKTLEELADLSHKYKKIKLAAVLYQKTVYSFVDGKLQDQK